LSRLVILDESRHDEFGGLKRRKSLVAIQALTTPANLPAVTGKARVDYLGFFVAAKRAMHSVSDVHGEALA
jgi:hypothetical protein